MKQQGEHNTAAEVFPPLPNLDMWSEQGKILPAKHHREVCHLRDETGEEAEDEDGTVVKLLTGRGLMLGVWIYTASDR